MAVRPILSNPHFSLFLSQSSSRDSEVFLFGEMKWKNKKMRSINPGGRKTGCLVVCCCSEMSVPSIHSCDPTFLGLILIGEDQLIVLCQAVDVGCHTSISTRLNISHFETSKHGNRRFLTANNRLMVRLWCTENDNTGSGLEKTGGTVRLEHCRSVGPLNKSVSM